MKSGKKILILGAGLEQTLAINEAKSLGLYVIACDQNPNACGLKEANVGIVCDITDTGHLVEIGRQYNVDGVFCHAVEIPQVVSGIAEQLKLPGLTTEVAVRATDKLKRISWLKEHGIPVANFMPVYSADEIEEKANKLGFPLVMKPVDNAGARGVRVVNRNDELEEAYCEAIRFSKSKVVLIEELLSGPQISTESVIYQDQLITFAFADRNYELLEDFSPYFVEDGIDYPSSLPEETQKAVLAIVDRTIRTLEIDFGAAKGDVIIHNGKPKIIEMAARTSGGWFGAGSIRIATGVNMLKPLLQMAVGDKPDLEVLRPTKKLFCAQRYLIPRESGEVISVSGVEEVASMPGVEMFTSFLPKVGDRIVRSTNNAQRYAQVICTGVTLDEAIMRCKNAIARIKIQLKPLVK